MSQPDRPKIYHIVHMDRLESIASDGFLWSDKEILSRTVGGTTIGMGKIKERRLRLPVKCHPQTTVGEFVPFYYCPRSIMLYLIHMRHPDVAFKDGQESIVHLEFDLDSVVEWVNADGRLWAIALSNAGALYTEFRKELAGLAEIDWEAVNNNDFRSSVVKEGKQAEFLVHRSVPWVLVKRVGVHNGRIQRAVQEVLRGFEHQPTVEVLRDWYY
jgi:ssDNA thymidine ADP-ribosyltransferase, DarT